MQINPNIKFVSMECLECDKKDQLIAQLTGEIKVLKSEVATLQSQQDVKKSEEVIYQETWDLINVTSNKIDDMLSQCISFESIQQKQLSSDDIFKTTIIDSSASATLIQYLLKQTNNQKTTLNCICQRKLSVENLKQLFNQYHYNMISNQLFNNQIKELKEKCKEKIGCCKNRFCHFFFFSEKESQSYCPLCLC